MSLRDDILDSSRLRLEGDFDDQVEYLLQEIRLTRREVENLSYLFDDLTQTLQRIWPECQVYPFGSIVTGLGIRTSDVDCYIELPQWAKNEAANDGDIVMTAKRIMMRKYNLFSEVFAIPQAKVPIVKFFHIPNKRNCDISFKSPAGVENSKLVGYILHLDKRALHLAVLVKYWGKIHNLTGTNLLSNYSMIILVIFYLQQINILPPVHVIQRSVPPKMVDHWDTAFNEHTEFESDNHDSLYLILGEFFKYYIKFNFNSDIVSPYLGRPVKKTMFKDLNTVPDEFELYNMNVMSNVCPVLKVDTVVCIQDLLDHSRNCSVAIHAKLAEKLKWFFNDAAYKFAQVPPSKFLQSIMKQAPELKQSVKTNPKSKVTKPKQNVRKVKQTLRNNVNSLFKEFSRFKKGKS